VGISISTQLIKMFKFGFFLFKKKGANSFGQLGINNNNFYKFANNVVHPFLTNTSLIQGISNSVTHSLFLYNKNVYSCGYNNDGELGLGFTGSFLTNVSQVTFFNGLNVSFVLTGYYISYVSVNNGLPTSILYTFGYGGVKFLLILVWTARFNFFLYKDL
jgi:hypothetical protein